MGKMRTGGAAAAAVLLLAGAAGGCGLDGGRMSASWPSPSASELVECRDAGQRLLKALRRLTAADAVRIALANNPDYRSFFFAVGTARFRYYQAMGAYLPRVDASVAVGQNLQENRNLVHPQADMAPRQREFATGAGLSASWLLFDGLAREFDVLIAAREFDRQAALDENARRLLVRAVLYAYNDLLLAREQERINLADLEFQDACLRQSETRFRYGLVPRSDVLNFKIQGSLARSRLVTARYRIALSRFVLAALMGYPAGTLPEELDFSPLSDGGPERLPEVGLYLDLALARRPDLRAYRYWLRIATLKRWRSWSPWWPTVTAFAGVEFNTSASRFGSHSVSHSYYNQGLFDYGVTAAVNLFDGFRTYQRIRESGALEKEAACRLESAFLECVGEVRSAYANYRNCAEQTALYREMLNWVFEQRQLVRIEYLGGRETITRLNGAQSDLVTAEGNLAIMLAELNKARAQLEAAVAAPLPEAPRRAYERLSAPEPLETLLRRLDRRYPSAP